MSSLISDRDRAPLVGLAVGATGVLLTLVSFWALTWWTQGPVDIGLTSFRDCGPMGHCESMGIGNLHIDGWRGFEGIAIGTTMLGTFVFLMTGASSALYIVGVIRWGRTRPLRLTGYFVTFVLIELIWLQLDAPEAASAAAGTYVAFMGLATCLAGVTTLDVYHHRAPLFGIALPDWLKQRLDVGAAEESVASSHGDGAEQAGSSETDVSCRRCGAQTRREAESRYRCEACGLISLG